jgi:hypothetical protein
LAGNSETNREVVAHCFALSPISTRRLAANAKDIRKDLDFAVLRLTEMLLNLKQYYYAARDGGDALAYRLIRHPAKSTQEVKGSLRDHGPRASMNRGGWKSRGSDNEPQDEVPTLAG